MSTELASPVDHYRPDAQIGDVSSRRASRAGPLLIGAAVVSLSGCCLQISGVPIPTAGAASSGGVGTSAGTTAAATSSAGSSAPTATSSSSGGTSSGGGASSGTTTGRGPGCTIDGQFYPAYSANPSNAASCCNPKLDEHDWVPLFVKSMSFPVDSGMGPEDGLATDLNGDGIADVVVATSTANGQQAQLWVYLSANGGYSGPWIFAPMMPNGSSGAGRLTLGDFAGEGTEEILYSQGWPGAIYQVNAIGWLQLEATLSNPCTGGELGVIDYNSDGLPDVVWVTSCGLTLYLNDGDGGLVWQSTPIAADLWTQPMRYGTGLAIADFDGDGLPDLAYVGLDGGVCWLQNSGHNLSGDAGGSLSIGSPDSWVTILAVMPYSDGTGIAYARNRPSFGMCGIGASFGSLQGCSDSQFEAQMNIEGANLTTGDVNGDGQPDVLMAGSVVDAGSWVEVVVFDPSSRTEKAFGSQPVQGDQSIQQIAAGDLNGDGFADLVIFRDGGPWEGWLNTCGPGPLNAP